MLGAFIPTIQRTSPSGDMTDAGGVALGRLWAGWRSALIMDVGNGEGGEAAPKPECVFCAILASGMPDAETHIVWRHPDGVAIAILNLYPYTSGHLMVMPTRHVGEVEALTGDESVAVWGATAEAVRVLKSTYRPDALNLGANLGRAAGAGVPGHFHLHVVPRWSGDTNFMTAVADARVLPEALADTDARLRAAWPIGPAAS
ncbi:MAG: HIT domain-containing protein [Actinomycetota bacterium]|nr:HIT domain-containing protein [Actinomycetota bacterium]